MIEDSINRLNEIAEKLDKNTNLDEAIKLYEEGCKLAKTCLNELEKDKGKITMIKKEYTQKDDE